MHRAHEELCKMALDRINADGVLIHMTLGKLKEGDIPGDVRDKAIRKMVELYFAPNTAIILEKNTSFCSSLVKNIFLPNNSFKLLCNIK